MAAEGKKALLNLISDVKARLNGKIDSVTFPIPQFIVVGKQSVGKSRLIESLAGETFNFVSGTLGSRRPTVLEFRNVPGLTPARWSVFNTESNVWKSHPITEVMRLVGEAHEKCGKSVTEVPIYVKVEGADTVDLGIVDLPGFRTYSKDGDMQELSKKIEKLVTKFMQDENNVMLCVEEAGDSAGYFTLGKCREVDPSYRRTVLVRNKLDKYYGDLSSDNVNKWLQGYSDLPDTLLRFAMSLPHWTTPSAPMPFADMRKTCAKRDIRTLEEKGMSLPFKKTIGVENFLEFLEGKTQELFSDALAPMLTKLKALHTQYDTRRISVRQDINMTGDEMIVNTTRQAGICFAQSFNFLMEGQLVATPKRDPDGIASSRRDPHRPTLEDELKAFAQYAARTDGLSSVRLVPSAFKDLDGYVNYLRDTVMLPGMDVELNGGAQFKRLMYEVEVFTRFAGMGGSVTQEEIWQSRGDASWEGVVRQLLQRGQPNVSVKTSYASERLKYFFMQQKDCTLQFMMAVKNSPEEHLYSARLHSQGTVIYRNRMMKDSIYETFDDAVTRHQVLFMQMWDDWMKSMFANPLKLLKAGSMQKVAESYECSAPTEESTKRRIKEERHRRDNMKGSIESDIKKIPDSDMQSAAGMVQQIIEKTFSRIRCAVSDQMELYCKSFFLLPMLRRLEGDMAKLELAEEDRKRYRAHKATLEQEERTCLGLLEDLTYCIDSLQTFRITS